MSSSVNSNQKKPLLSQRDSPSHGDSSGSQSGVDDRAQDEERTATVSTLTKTPWGDIVPRRTSQISKPTPPNSKLKPGLSTKTKSSPSVTMHVSGARTSPGPKPAPPAYKPAASSSQLGPPGPKPSLPGPKPPGLKPLGPKPAIPGPKPKLPGPKPKLPGPKPQLPGPKPILPVKPKPNTEQPKSPKGASPEVSPSFTKHGMVNSDEWVMIDSLISSPRFPRTTPTVEKQTSFPFPDPKKKQMNGQETGQHRSPCGSPVLGRDGRVSPSTPPGSPRRKPPTMPSSPSPLSTASSARSGSPTVVVKHVGTIQQQQQPGASTRLLAPSTAVIRNDARASTLPRLGERKRTVSSSSSPDVVAGDVHTPSGERRSRLGALDKATGSEERLRLQSSSPKGSFEQVFNEQKHMQFLEVQRLSLDLSTDSSDGSPQTSPSGSTTDIAAHDHLHPMLAEQRLSAPATAEEPVEATPAKPDLTPEELVEKHRNKRYNIAKELRDTEVKYVSRLKLVAVDFYEAISAVNTEKKTIVPDSAFHQIFLNIIPIYKFNNELLTQLQGMLELWEKSESLGEVLSRLAPFLKLYSQYTSNFHSAMEALTAWAKKEKRFDAALKQFELSPTCGGLSVAHHMLEPVQRIPRYRLLLADYLKYLPEDSPDYKPAEKALVVISEAADAANNRIKDLERLSEILAIQRSLQDYEEPLVAPGRTLIKKGRLNKFSRKTTQQRAFFLFSDMLIHATISSAGGYKCRDVMPILGMEVSLPMVSPVPYTFTVVSTTRSLTLAANTEDEKQEWYETLGKVIKDVKNKFKSLKRDDSVDTKESQDSAFGVKAPVWLPDDSVSMCMICCAEFKLTFRRHHCRACGKVICNNCFKYKVYLRYKGKADKICDGCFQEAKKQGLVGQESIDEHEDATDGDIVTPTQRTVLDLKAVDEDTVVANYLLLMQEGKRNFSRFWFQLKKDCVLYRFKAHEDVRAIESIPLPGYDIRKEGSNTLVLIHKISVHTPGADASKRETHRLKVEEGDVDTWMELLVKASCFELDEVSS